MDLQCARQNFVDLVSQVQQKQLLNDQHGLVKW